MKSNETPFAEGATLWIVPDQGYWFPRIDWEVNFLFTRFKNRRSTSMAPQLQDIAKQEEIEILDLKPESDSLMVPSAPFLPNQMTVLFKNKRGSAWIESVRQIWVDLKKPKTRLFLPDNTSAAEFKKECPAEMKQMELVESPVQG